MTLGSLRFSRDNRYLVFTAKNGVWVCEDGLSECFPDVESAKKIEVVIHDKPHADREPLRCTEFLGVPDWAPYSGGMLSEEANAWLTKIAKGRTAVYAEVWIWEG